MAKHLHQHLFEGADIDHLAACQRPLAPAGPFRAGRIGAADERAACRFLSEADIDEHGLKVERLGAHIGDDALRADVVAGAAVDQNLGPHPVPVAVEQQLEIDEPDA